VAQSGGLPLWHFLFSFLVEEQNILAVENKEEIPTTGLCHDIEKGGKKGYIENAHRIWFHSQSQMVFLSVYSKKRIQWLDFVSEKETDLLFETELVCLRVCPSTTAINSASPSL
jgi:hypothetical protein